MSYVSAREDMEYTAVPTNAPAAVALLNGLSAAEETQFYRSSRWFFLLCLVQLVGRNFGLAQLT
jgi:hypothetical protein